MSRKFPRKSKSKHNIDRSFVYYDDRKSRMDGRLSDMNDEDRKVFLSYIKQRQSAENKGNLDSEARLSNYIGDLFEKYDNFEKAIEEHERALRLREVLGKKIDIAVAFRTLGECYCKKKDYTKAHSLHERYLSLARDCDDLVEQQRALTTIGNTFLEQSNDRSFSAKKRRDAGRKAENIYLRSLEVCEQLKQTIDEKEFIDMKSRNFYNLGLVYDGLEDAETSKKYLSKALTLCQKHYLLDMLYVCQKALGDIYLKYNQLEEAGKFFDEAFETSKKLKNKQLEIEVLWFKTQVFILKKQYSEARHLLKKIRKLMRGDKDELPKLVAYYQTVVHMERAMENLKKTNKENVAERIPLYDKLGDCAVDLKMYGLAINYYSKVLEASISVNKDRKELIPIYISLAQTYVDWARYDKAIVYFKKEIECYGDENPEQVARSWLNIAAYEERSDMDYKKIQMSYVNAYNAAKKAANRKLQCRALCCFIELFRINQDEKSLKKAKDQLDHIKNKYNIMEAQLEEDSQVTEEEDADDDTLVEEDEIEMSDLTESEEDEENVVKTVRMLKRNGKRAKVQKRNDFGETPLHRACIKGELSKVKQLIAEGHPVNVQDNSGWIPLHEAANNNWYDITEYLLQHGADIDHRGGPQCEGMTPLIDAASVGCLDIVELLLKYGANALAKDDKQMTALDHLLKLHEEDGSIDRKTEIQFNNIIGILREKMPGHSGTHRVKALTQSKQPALVPKSESYVGSQSLPKISRKPKTGTQRRSRNDIIIDSDSDSDDSQLDNSHNKSHRTVHMDTDDSENICPSFSDDQDDCDLSATDAYRQAISKVGQSACRASQAKPKKRTDDTAKPALIAEEEFIDNDWLVDDLRPVKQKKVDVNGFLSTGNIRKRSRSGSISPIPCIERRNKVCSSSKKKRIRIETDSDSETEVGNNFTQKDEPRLSVVPSTECEDELDNIDVLFNDDIDFEVTTSTQKSSPVDSSCNNFNMKKNSQKQLKLTDYGGSVTYPLVRTNFSFRQESVVGVNSAIDISQSCTVSREKPLNNVIRVKVNVEGVLLLIPVLDSDGSKTFSWLAEEAAKRYYKMKGVKLKLSLGKDGAHFSPEDLVSFLLADNDMVESYIDSKDEQPPMADCYRKACTSLRTVCYKNILVLLQSCEVSGKLHLVDLALRPARFQPVIRSLQHQTCLRELDLKGNRICDIGLDNLCKVVNSMPNLVYLGLACNDVTVEGLKSLCAAVSIENSKALQNLTSLDLSHNPLYDGSLVSLAQLIRRLPLLTKLSISSCKLTTKFFQNDRQQLTEALHKSSLQHFDISYNMLGCVGIELFLKCQNPTQILSLDLSATVPDHRSSQIYRHIYNFASQDKCVLQDLKLCQCNLGMEDADFLARLPSICRLQKLDISENPKLLNPVLQQLLQASVDEKSELEEITANHCGFQSPLSVDFLDALTEKMSARVPLRLLELTCFKLEKLDIESLTQIWKGKFEEFGAVHCDMGNVKLSVLDR